MTIPSSETGSNRYVGNGAVSEYDYTFVITDEADLLVTATDLSDVDTVLTLNVDYTVAGVGDAGGGAITLLGGYDPLTSLFVLNIEDDPLVSQLEDFSNQSNFFSQNHENAFDRATRLVRRALNLISGGVLKFPSTVLVTDFDPEIPKTIVGQTNVTIMSNTAGDGFEKGPTATDIANAEPNAVAAAASAVAAAASAVAAAASALALVDLYALSIDVLPAVIVGNTVNVAGYHPATTIGGGDFVGKTAARHDGGTNIDPTRVAEFGTAAYYVGSGVDAPCWSRISGGMSDTEWFGSSEVTIYVSPSGSDSNNGLSSSSALKTITAAADAINGYGPILKGQWIVELAAGTYGGGFALSRYLVSNEILKIIGPTVGHPNVPTAIIDFDTDNTQTRGILIRSRSSIWIEDIKVQGNFSQAISGSQDARFELRNIHLDGQGTANVGIDIDNQSRYFVRGGRIEGYAIGISELFGVVRSLGSGGSTHTDSMTIADCTTGIKAKENCSGHASPLIIEDCDVGLELQAWSAANVGSGDGLLVQRCDKGIVTTNSEIHNERQGIFGYGANANGINILAVGNSSELASMGWVAGPPYNIRTGHRPLVTYYADYVSQTISAIGEQSVYDSGSVLNANTYSVKGKRINVEVKGTVNVTTTAINEIKFRLGGTFIGTATIPIGVAANSDFSIKCEIVCSVDGNFQRVCITGTVGTTVILTAVSDRTADLVSLSAGNKRGVTVTSDTTQVSATIDFDFFEVWA